MNTRLQHLIEDPAARLALARQALRRGDQETLDRLCGEDAAVERWRYLTDDLPASLPRWRDLARSQNGITLDGVAFPAWTYRARRLFLCDCIEHAALEHEGEVRDAASVALTQLRSASGYNGSTDITAGLTGLTRRVNGRRRAMAHAITQAWLSPCNLADVIAHLRGAVEDAYAEHLWQRAALRGYLLGEVGA